MKNNYLKQNYKTASLPIKYRISFIIIGKKNHSVIPSGFRHCKGEETYFSFIKTDASNYIYTQISSVVVVVFRLPSSAVSNFLKCLQFFFVEIPSR